jgi:hypothetical protein
MFIIFKKRLLNNSLLVNYYLFYRKNWKKKLFKKLENNMFLVHPLWTFFTYFNYCYFKNSYIKHNLNLKFFSHILQKNNCNKIIKFKLTKASCILFSILNIYFYFFIFLFFFLNRLLFFKSFIFFYFKFILYNFNSTKIIQKKKTNLFSKIALNFDIRFVAFDSLLNYNYYLI